MIIIHYFVHLVMQLRSDWCNGSLGLIGVVVCRCWFLIMLCFFCVSPRDVSDPLGQPVTHTCSSERAPAFQCPVVAESDGNGVSAHVEHSDLKWSLICAFLSLTVATTPLRASDFDFGQWTPENSRCRACSLVLGCVRFILQAERF